MSREPACHAGDGPSESLPLQLSRARPSSDLRLHSDESEEELSLIALRRLDPRDDLPRQRYETARVGSREDRLMIVVGLLALLTQFEETIGDCSVSASIWMAPPDGARSALICGGGCPALVPCS